MRTLFAGLLLLSPTALVADQNHAPQTAEYCGDCHRAIQSQIYAARQGEK